MCPRRLPTMPYKKSMLEAAVKAVMAGTFTTKQSASVYGVPVGTVGTQLRRKGYSGRTKRQNGNLIQVDQQVLEWLQLMSEIGCFSLKNQLGDILKEVFERLGLGDKLTAKMATHTLTLKFLQRNPNVPSSFIESKGTERNLTASHIDEWIAKQKEHILTTYNIAINEFLVESNAGNVFCCFEVGSVFPSLKNKFSRLIYKPKLDGPLLLTLYCCLCADGSFLKPVAVVKNENVSQTKIDNTKSEFHILYSKHGKMDCEAAMLWLQLIDAEIKPKKGEKPCFIYLDQFIRPLSLATLDFCRQRQLILYYLPGHYPHVKLPFGMDVFYNLNGEYDAILASDDAKHHASSTELTLSLLVDAWKQMLATNAATTEFRDFGILPFDPTALKNIVETIVPITMSSSDGVNENVEVGNSSKGAAAVLQSPNSENEANSPKNIHCQVPSPECHASPTGKRASRAAVLSYKESSDTDEQAQPTSLEDGPAVSQMDPDATTDGVPQKPNIKLKIKRTNQTQNDFCVESRPHNENPSQFRQSVEQPAPRDFPSESRAFSMSCSHCGRERLKALKSGVVEGLLYALKRIESSLRADTLHLYKTRYLSPYLRDHRPTEPSFLMWCEIMKCLEVGPEAVHQDYLVSRNIHEARFISSKEMISTKPSLPRTLHIPCNEVNQCLRSVNERDASGQSSHSHPENLAAPPAVERNCHSRPMSLPLQDQESFVSRASQVPATHKPSDTCGVDLNNNTASVSSSSVLYSTADRHSGRSVPKLQTECQNAPMTEDFQIKRLPERPGMYNHYQGKPNCSGSFFVSHSANNNRDMTENSLLQGSVQGALASVECNSHTVPGNQRPQVSPYSSLHSMQLEQESSLNDHHQQNFEARPTLQSPKYHGRCGNRLMYEPAQNIHSGGMQQAIHQQAQNLQSQQTFCAPQQQIRFSGFPTQQQQQQQQQQEQQQQQQEPTGEHVALQFSAQEQKVCQVPPAFEPGQLHRNIAAENNTGFPTFCSPYKQTSTPKSIPVPFAGQQVLSTAGMDSSNPQVPAGAFDLKQNEQLGLQCYDDRMAMASHNGFKNGVCAVNVYGMATSAVDLEARAPTTSVGSQMPSRSMHSNIPPAAEVWSQNPMVPMSVPHTVWAYPPNDPISQRAKAFDFTSRVCSAVQQQQSVISYQNYLAATSSYSRAGLAQPVTSAEELPKTASYTNL